MTEAIVLSLLIGYLRGGRISQLAMIRFKGVILIFTALVLRYGANYMASKGYNPVLKYNLILQLVAYSILLIAIYLNLNLSGFRFIGLGTILNFLVIVANGGQMPVWSKVLTQNMIDYLMAGKSTTHALLTGSTKLSFLGDIIYIPPPYPLAQLVSVGDIFISIGVFLLIQNKLMNVNPRQPYKFIQFQRKF